MAARTTRMQAERDAIRAEVAEIVSLAGADGRSVKERLALAATRLGLSYRRARAFRARSADPWAWEADRLRRAEMDLLRRRAARLEHDIATTKARLARHEDMGGAAAAVDR